MQEKIELLNEKIKKQYRLYLPKVGINVYHLKRPYY